ncbi:MAG TPA: histidine phosphatase family protein [Aliiroseovarius sp.]|nr:histidine phosphatase family protein [Aliiroseovarius sp.]
MTDYPELYVIRHGQTEWNVAGRHQGRMDSPLTDTGKAQARAVAGLLPQSGIQAFTSPLGRTKATAALVFQGSDQVAREDARLSEVGFGDWEGLCWDDIAARWPDRAAMAEQEPFLWHFQAPGGETLAEVSARCQSFLNDLTGPAIVITHGISGRVLRGLWLGQNEYGMTGLPGGQGVVFHLSQAHGHRVLTPAT